MGCAVVRAQALANSVRCRPGACAEYYNPAAALAAMEPRLALLADQVEREGYDAMGLAAEVRSAQFLGI